MTAAKSISFDRAADVYEATRGFPPGIGEQVAEAALEFIPPGAFALEIGVGTGRIARPLADRGVRLVGVDLSRKMMAELRRRATEAMPLLVEADAVRLPLASAAFDAVLSVHVFHLIPDWQAALAELRRVLRPGGVYLTGYDWRPPDSPGARLFARWRNIVSAHGFPGDVPGARDFDEIKQHLLDSGARLEERFVGEWAVTRTLAQMLETIEHRTWSSTWGVPDDFFPRCLAELREWAIAEFGPPETAFTVTHRFCWQAFRLTPN
ncbi:MAG: class I SAM-dependent methyltransferase [Anaerolineales bacterium]|nr:class I SAM-dependent methyltransferase [Anaerolineales bacterium]